MGSTKSLNLMLYGNAESIHFARWVDYLIDNSPHRVSILTYNHVENLTKCRRVYRVNHYAGPNFLRSFLIGFEIRRILRQNEIDVLHTHYVSYNNVESLICRRVTKIASLWGGDVMIDERSRLRSPVIRWAKKTILGFILRSQQCVTYHSEYLLRYVKSKYRVDEERLEFISFGYDDSANRGDRKNKDPDCYTILCPRNIGEVYNTKSLLIAYKMLREEMRGRTLQLILKRYYGSDSYLAETREFIRANEIDGVEILGFLPDEQYQEVFMNSDMIVSVASFDGLSVSVLEALHYAKPVVLSDIDVYRLESIDGSVFWANPTDATSVFEAMRSAVVSDEVAESQWVRKHCRSKNMDRMAELYERMVGSFQRSRKARR